MADRYIADRFLPDKAIDLVDEAAAKLKMEITSKPLALDEIDRKVSGCECKLVKSLASCKLVRVDECVMADDSRNQIILIPYSKP